MERTINKDIHKIIKVVHSCKTYEQLTSALRFIHLAQRHWGYRKHQIYWDHIENIYVHQKKLILNED